MSYHYFLLFFISFPNQHTQERNCNQRYFIRSLQALQYLTMQVGFEDVVVGVEEVGILFVGVQGGGGVIHIHTGARASLGHTLALMKS
jgi:hypothetical protein